MGACFSSHDKADTFVSARGSSPHDSVQSTTQRGGKQQLKQLNKKQGEPKNDKQQGQAKKQKSKRMPHIDMSTGKVIPDFGVYGVFDVLYELGSGGSGQTYLCRWATSLTSCS